MRLSLLTLVLAGAGLGACVGVMIVRSFEALKSHDVFTTASSTPIRVVVVSNTVRVGNAADVGNAGPVAHVLRPLDVETYTNGTQRGHTCGLFRDRALALTNKFREFFGLERIEPPSRIPHFIDSVPFIGTPIGLPKDHAENDNNDRIIIKAQLDTKNMNKPEFVHILPVPNRPDAEMVRQHAVAHRRLHGSFLRRIHRALMALGPWEGRAVAFVLGIQMVSFRFLYLRY